MWSLSNPSVQQKPISCKNIPSLLSIWLGTDHDPDQKRHIWVVKCLWYHFPINLVDVLVIILVAFYPAQERGIPLYHAASPQYQNRTTVMYNTRDDCPQERLDPFIPCLPLHRATATVCFLPQLFSPRLRSKNVEFTRNRLQRPAGSIRESRQTFAFVQNHRDQGMPCSWYAKMNYCLVGTYRLQSVNTEVIYLTQEQKSKKNIWGHCGLLWCNCWNCTQS